MTRFGWLIFAGALLVVALVTAILFFVPKETPPIVAPVQMSENLEGQSIYVSGEYGFSVRYPSSAKIEEPFSASYLVNDSWRANASDAGTPLIAIIPYEIKSENSYPRSYATLVRIGASTDESAVDNCEKVTADSGETVLTDKTINGTTWKAFSFGDAAMQKYVKGVSYRTVHEGACFAIEQIASGSSYREEESADDIAQEVLDGEFDKLEEVVDTFVFSRP